MCDDFKCRFVCLYDCQGFLKCDEIAAIGLDHADNSHEHINISKDHPIYKNAFTEMLNPEFNTWCVMNPNQLKWREELMEVLPQNPINFINCTEGGSLFGPGIKCMKFEEYLCHH